MRLNSKTAVVGPGRPMRILGLSTSYPLRAGMAAGIFVQKLYAHFPVGYSIEVLSPDDDELDAGRERGVVPPAIRVRYAPRRWQRLGQRNGGILPSLRSNRMLLLLIPALLGSLTLAALRRVRRVDVIHANWSICGAVGAVVVAARKVGLVTTLRGEDTGPDGGSWWTRILLAICVTRSDAVVCVSRAMANGLASRYPRHATKIHVIHNGVDRSLHTLPRATPKDGCLRLLVVGSIVRRKGLDVLLQALANTKAECRIELVVAGDGPERSELQAFADRLPESRTVSWLGEVPPDRVSRLLSTHDVLVLASRSEGRPNVVIEALAAGMPVISTRLPGIDGLVEDGVTGWLVDVEDSPGMALAIERAANMATRTSFGEAARRLSLARSESWEATAAAYASLFTSVANLRRRGG